MTTQQESRSRITHRDFQRRGATEPQRAALKGMWGKSHAGRGIYIPRGEDDIPHYEVASIAGADGRSKDERWCERCKRVGRIMHYMETKRFRCCGRPA